MSSSEIPTLGSINDIKNLKDIYPELASKIVEDLLSIISFHQARYPLNEAGER